MTESRIKRRNIWRMRRMRRAYRWLRIQGFMV